jgi:GDP-mannose 6-dehydrogenase
MQTPGSPEKLLGSIALFGMGYVGCVSACCLAKSGYRVLGVEIIPEKVEALNRGEVPFVEPGLPELALEVRQAGRLSATADAHHAVNQAEVSMICVGTPGKEDGYPDFSHLHAVCRTIGEALRSKDDIHDVIIRSTVLPGTAEECAQIVAEASGKREGDGFRLLVNPEFLREGTAIKDYYSPPFTVIGAEHEDDAVRVRGMYAKIDAPLFVLRRREAELVKYSSNLFHAVKVVFGNEIGRICKAAGVDSHRVMEVFCHDDKLNLSRYYLKPGYAYGGSCLPKDLGAIMAYARRQQLSLEMFESVHVSNDHQIDIAREMIHASGKKRVALFGLSFKPTTDDVRSSPLVLLAERLVRDGVDLRIYDRNVVVSKLLGENKTFLKRHLPQASELLCDSFDELLEWGECLVIGNRLAEAGHILARAKPEQDILDLVRVADSIQTRARYHGLGWEVAANQLATASS